MSYIKYSFKVLLLTLFFASTGNAMVPYNNQGVVNQMMPELNQIIINNTVYELAPSAVIHHTESAAPVFEQIQIGQPIGYLLLETETDLIPQQITDIWIIE